MEQKKNIINTEMEDNEMQQETTQVESTAKKPKTLWVKKRHRFMNCVLKVVLAPYIRLRYGYRYDKFKATKNEPYLILSNHQTGYDQFLVAKAISNTTYFVANEDIFSMGFPSTLIKYLVAPVPIKKGSVDLSTIKTCMQIRKEGGSIVIFPEGNRTFSGENGYIKPSIAKLVKALKMPLALFKIHGGYGVSPRWADKLRRGKMYGHVKLTLSYDEYKDMPDEELYNLICETLYVDESINGLHYKGRKKAQYLERLLYVCPNCGITELKSNGNYFECEKCGTKLVYTETGDFLSATAVKAPFKTVKDWYNYQNQYMLNFDTTPYINEPLFSDDISFNEVIPCEKKLPIFSSGKLSIYSDRLEIVGKIKTDEGETEELVTFAISEISDMCVYGKNKLTLYVQDKMYNIKGLKKNFNAVKYLNFFYLNKNKELNNGSEFLGL